MEGNQMIKPVQVCIHTKDKYQQGIFKDFGYSRFVRIFIAVGFIILKKKYCDDIL